MIPGHLGGGSPRIPQGGWLKALEGIPPAVLASSPSHAPRIFIVNVRDSPISCIQPSSKL